MGKYLIINKKKRSQVFKHNKKYYDDLEKAEICIAIRSIQTEKQNIEFGILEVGKWKK